MLASVIDVGSLVETFGYPLLFLLVAAESSGVPIPGETSLIAAAVLASQGKLQIELVIPLAALAAIVGDNIGYVIGRRGGRWLLERPGAFQRQRQQALTYGESFFARHGPKAVFFGRFVLGLRVWASWLAGATRMRWRSFFLWNALGGICWATAIGVLAYSLGKAAGNVVEAFGIYGLAAVLILVIAVVLEHRRRRRHRRPAEDQATVRRAPEHAPPSQPDVRSTGRPRTPTT
ncbi:MAG TPA: DedA family protein [Solirubrobacteraceae bacterium]|nr:DedA family protein [Solirubrobacteraceae bacterium]